MHIKKRFLLSILSSLLLFLSSESFFEGVSLAQNENSLKICYFNIRFLGQSADRYNEGLASILKDFDMVIVQELIAPPTAWVYPSGEVYPGDPEAKAFFDEMEKHGFSYDLSPEDTGPGEENHDMTSATEWFVVFYKDTVELAYDLPWGFIADDLSAHPVYRRVPYAHAFRTKDDKLDFVIINVHLYPTARKRRILLLLVT